jgi:hypothetical protein
MSIRWSVRWSLRRPVRRSTRRPSLRRPVRRPSQRSFQMSFLWLWRGMPTLEERSATFGSSRQLFQTDLPHDLVEGRTRAERRLNDGEQFLSVVSEEALRLGCVKLREGDDDIRVVWVERLHDERLPLAAHLEEDVQLDYAPQPRCIAPGRTSSILQPDKKIGSTTRDWSIRRWSMHACRTESRRRESGLRTTSRYARGMW